MEEAADCQKEMLKSAEGALKLISKVVADTKDFIEMGKELKQNASWAVKDVETLGKAVEPVREDLEMKRTGLPPDNIGKSLGAVKECETAMKALKEEMFLVDQGIKSCVKRMKRARQR